MPPKITQLKLDEWKKRVAECSPEEQIAIREALDDTGLHITPDNNRIQVWDVPDQPFGPRIDPITMYLLRKIRDGVVHTPTVVKKVAPVVYEYTKEGTKAVYRPTKRVVAKYGPKVAKYGFKKGSEFATLLYQFTVGVLTWISHHSMKDLAIGISAMSMGSIFLYYSLRFWGIIHNEPQIIQKLVEEVATNFSTSNITEKAISTVVDIVEKAGHNIIDKTGVPEMTESVAGVANTIQSATHDFRDTVSDVALFFKSITTVASYTVCFFFLSKSLKILIDAYYDTELKRLEVEEKRALIEAKKNEGTILHIQEAPPAPPPPALAPPPAPAQAWTVESMRHNNIPHASVTTATQPAPAKPISRQAQEYQRLKTAYPQVPHEELMLMVDF